MSGLRQAEREEPRSQREPNRWSRARPFLSRVRPGTWAVLGLIAIVLVGNLPYLSGLTDPNPLGPRSALSVDSPGLVGGGNTLDPTDGYITQALGHLAATDILHGRLPLWNPYEGAGMPLFGEGQSAALFPPTLLLAISNGQFWEDLLLELVAAVGTYLVLRRLGCRRVVSVAAGAVFGLNGAFAWLATTSFNPIAFLPWVVLGLEHAYDAGLTRRRGGWGLIAVALALSIYAGFPETAYLDALVAVAWFLWRCGCAGRERLIPFVGKALAGALGGLLLAAPFLVAFIGALPHEFVGFHNGQATAITMPPYAFPQLFLPYVYGAPLEFSDPAGTLQSIWGHAGGYLPIGLTFLALVSLLDSGRRGLKLILVVWVVLALSTVYGDPPLLRSLLPLLPGGSSVAFYRYTFAAITFALVVLAALGTEALMEGLKPRRLAASLLAGAGAIALFAYEAHHVVVHLDGGSGHTRWAWAQVAWAAAVVAAIGVVGLQRRRLFRYLAPGALALDAVLMFAVHELPATTAAHLDRAPVQYLQAHLGQQRFFTFGPIAANYGGYWRLASLNDIDLPLPTRWTDYVERHLDNYVNPVFFVGNDGGGRSLTAPTPLQELMRHLSEYRADGVSYVVSAPGERLPADHHAWQLVRKTAVAWIYHVPGAAPYFSAGSGCELRPRGREQVQTDCARSSSLVRRELLFPGWSATVDGRRVPVRRVQDIFQGVSVPAGRHTVSFSYSPPQFGLALVGLLIGALWVLAGIAVPRYGAPRRG